MQKLNLVFDDMEFLKTLMGEFDDNAKIFEEVTQVSLVIRGESLILIGEGSNIKKAQKLIDNLSSLFKAGHTLDQRLISYTFNHMEKNGTDVSIKRDTKITMPINSKGNPINPKTMGQKMYLCDIESHDITICIGPAGTGKTYLAVAMAYKALKSGQVERIVLTRPAVEAGESLGFLPGDLKDKVDPYLRPLYDGLFDMIGAEKFQDYMEKGIIEVAPLAFMRGRTLDNSFIILDEAQNTTREQMKMFLTRLGFGSKAVVTGDMTQLDLPYKRSGLIEATKILKNLDGIAICTLSREDVVRHKLVQSIIDAYEEYETPSLVEDENKIKNRINMTHSDILKEVL